MAKKKVFPNIGSENILRVFSTESFEFNSAAVPRLGVAPSACFFCVHLQTEQVELKKVDYDAIKVEEGTCMRRLFCTKFDCTSTDTLPWVVEEVEAL